MEVYEPARHDGARTVCVYVFVYLFCDLKSNDSRVLEAIPLNVIGSHLVQEVCVCECV